MIEVKGLYKDFGALHVLRGVSLNVEQGDIISIIGPSGSGKSTLLRSINLLEKPTYGEIWVEGKLITPPDPYLHWDVIRASKTYGGFERRGWRMNSPS
ncbi:MAG: ATP-binding cassette domain-containing protein [Lachnospiraceae bacterium]